MRQLKFYVCPQCGNLITATGSAVLSCCGRKLEALEPRKPDEEHRLTFEQVEDDWFITASHPMVKGHYLSFAALSGGEVQGKDRAFARQEQAPSPEKRSFPKIFENF